MSAEFVGRAAELSRIGAFLARETPAIAVIYGRRRIGKSLLIQQALRGRRALLFEGLENQPTKEQISSFLFQLARQTNMDAANPALHNWRDALYLLQPELARRPGCLVLDEFQWMANYRRRLVSDLKMVWERFLAQVPGVKLILCGSIASFMISKVVRSSALYGRTDLELNVKGFLLDETRRMLRGKGLDEVIEAYLYFGGVPKYLDLVRDHPSLHVAVNELAFTEGGYFVEEYERIFTSHFGGNQDFRKIIAALAERPEGLFRGQLVERAGVDAGGGLSNHLADLESAGFISAVVPFDKGTGTRLIKYRLSDPYLRFYFSFIRPNLRKIRAGTHSRLFTGLSQSGRFHAWRGKAFELLCASHARRIAEILGFAGIDFLCGPYFRAAAGGKRGGFQIDLLFSRADNVITLCEMKYAAAPVGTGVIAEVERKVESLQAVFPSKTIQRVLILHGSPSDALARAGYFYRIITSEELV